MPVSGFGDAPRFVRYVARERAPTCAQGLVRLVRTRHVVCCRQAAWMRVRFEECECFEERVSCRFRTRGSGLASLSVECARVSAWRLPQTITFVAISPC